MGYCVSLEEVNFRIKEENINEVRNKLKEYAELNKEIRWVDNSILRDLGHGLYAVFEELRYDMSYEDGYYEINDFTGEKLGDEFMIFNYIAQYVEKDSYLEYCGEDGCRFRFVFDGETCKEVYPKVDWE